MWDARNKSVHPRTDFAVHRSTPAAGQVRWSALTMAVRDRPKVPGLDEHLHDANPRRLGEGCIGLISSRDGRLAKSIPKSSPSPCSPLQGRVEILQDQVEGSLVATYSTALMFTVDGSSTSEDARQVCVPPVCTRILEQRQQFSPSSHECGEPPPRCTRLGRRAMASALARGGEGISPPGVHQGGDARTGLRRDATNRLSSAGPTAV